MAVLRAPQLKTCTHPECGITQEAHLFQRGKRRCNACLARAQRERSRRLGIPAKVERLRTVNGDPEALCMTEGCGWKPLDAFWITRTGTPSGRCRSCRTRKVMAWKRDHAERAREIQRRWSAYFELTDGHYALGGHE